MSYGVHYRTAAGEVRFELRDSLDEAVALVERLRNEESTPDARLFREVPLEVRTYVKVVVRDESAPAGAGDAPAPAAPATPSAAPPAESSGPSSTPPAGAMPLAPPVQSPPPATPAGDDDDEGNQRRAGLFSRS